MEDMCSEVSIFVSSTYMAVVYEVNVIVGYVLVHTCTIITSICQYRIKTVQYIFAMWQPCC